MTSRRSRDAARLQDQRSDALKTIVLFCDPQDPNCKRVIHELGKSRFQKLASSISYHDFRRDGIVEGIRGYPTICDHTSGKLYEGDEACLEFLEHLASTKLDTMAARPSTSSSSTPSIKSGAKRLAKRAKQLQDELQMEDGMMVGAGVRQMFNLNRRQWFDGSPASKETCVKGNDFNWNEYQKAYQSAKDRDWGALLSEREMMDERAAMSVSDRLSHGTGSRRDIGSLSAGGRREWTKKDIREMDRRRQEEEKMLRQTLMGEE